VAKQRRQRDLRRAILDGIGRIFKVGDQAINANIAA
jgi:hypothetical protein